MAFLGLRINLGAASLRSEKYTEYQNELAPISISNILFQQELTENCIQHYLLSPLYFEIF